MEIWKDIPGYEGKYQCSSLGNIRSSKSGRLRKLSRNRSGYLKINLADNGSFKYFSVHRLVALSFIEKPIGKDIVNHKNGIKTDNRVENLEWCTIGENQYHAYIIGLRPSCRLYYKTPLVLQVEKRLII